jgi:hypothetical protein
MTTYTNLVNASVDFLVSMQEYYGTDRALAVWDNMRNILGEDLAGDVFFKILSGDKTTVNIENYKIESDRSQILAIRAVRAITGFDLKQGKEFVDSLDFGVTKKLKMPTLDKRPSHYSLSDFIKDMDQAGYRVW